MEGGRDERREEWEVGGEDRDERTKKGDWEKRGEEKEDV